MTKSKYFKYNLNSTFQYLIPHPAQYNMAVRYLWPAPPSPRARTSSGQYLHNPTLYRSFKPSAPVKNREPDIDQVFRLTGGRWARPPPLARITAHCRAALGIGPWAVAHRPRPTARPLPTQDLYRVPPGRRMVGTNNLPTTYRQYMLLIDKTATILDHPCQMGQNG